MRLVLVVSTASTYFFQSGRKEKEESSMKKKWLVQISLVMICLVFAIGVQAADFKIPASTGKVTDLVGLLSSSEAEKLREELNRFENATSNDIAILITDSLQGQNVRDYGIEVAKKWGVGKKANDNGVLIVLAPKEKKYGVEVGYGLGGPLPDILAKELMEKYLVPKYREKKYYEGFFELIKQYEALTAKEYAPAEGAKKKASSNYDGAFIVFILILVIIVFVIGVAIYNNRNRYGGGGFGGGSSGGSSGSPWWIIGSGSGGGGSGGGRGGGSDDSPFGGGDFGGGGCSGDL